MTNKTGGPAFPVTLFEGQTLGDGSANGMTLRDYFAAKAMQVLCDDNFTEEQIAEASYNIADAMLKAREQ